MKRYNVLKSIGLWFVSNTIVFFACGALFTIIPERVTMLGLFNMVFTLLTLVWCYRIARYGAALPTQEETP